MSDITRVALDAMGGDNAPGRWLKEQLMLLIAMKI